MNPCNHRGTDLRCYWRKNVLALGNKNKKMFFILYFSHLIVSLASPKVLSFDNKNEKKGVSFCIVLT